jgi:hypothetical protein
LQKDEVIEGDLSLVGGTLDLNGHKLSVNGNVSASGGTLSISGGSMTVKSNFTTGANTSLQMNADADVLDVRGDVTIQGYGNKLTAGTLKVGGNFMQMNAPTTYSYYKTFSASGTHTVILDGDAAQTVSFEYPGGADASHFQNLKIANTSTDGVTFATDIYAMGTLEHVSGPLSGFEKMVMSGVETVVGNWPGSATVKSGWQLQKDEVIEGDLSLVGGTLDLNGHKLSVNGKFIITGGQITYTNNGRLIIPGDINNDLLVDLTDAIMAVQIISGVASSQTIFKDADVNHDGQIGIEEVIFILQKAAGIR